MLIWLAPFMLTAAAQEIPAVDAQLFRPSPDARSYQWTDDASRRSFGQSEGRIVFDYSHGAMGAVGADGTEKQVLDQVVGVDFVGALHMGPLRIGAHVPTYGLVSSDYAEASARGIGDVAADVKLTLVDPEAAQVGLALSGRFSAPTSTIELPLGSDGIGWSAGVIADADFVDWRATVNAGLRGVPAVEFSNLSVGNALWFRAAAAYTPSDESGLAIELAGQRALGGADPLGMPIEVLAGGYRQLAPSVTVRGALGTGLTGGLGASAVRAVVGLSFHPAPSGDADFDFIVDNRDACPFVPEDFDGFEDNDGCPEDDNDGDGILDLADGCIDAAEDMDGVKDEDGCPESATHLTVKVTADGEPWPTADIQLKRGPARPVAKMDEPVVVAPGVWELTVYAPGLSSVTQRILIEENEPKVHVVELQRLADYRWIDVALVDNEGRAVDGRVSIDGVEWQAVSGAGQRVSVPVGKSVLRAEAFGYQPIDRPMDLGAEGSKAIKVQMFPGWGTVHLVLMGPDGEPVEGVWLDEDTGGPIPIGREGIDNFVQEGEHRVRVAVDGYGEQVVDMVVVRDQITETVVHLVKQEGGPGPAPQAPAPE